MRAAATTQEENSNDRKIVAPLDQARERRQV